MIVRKKVEIKRNVVADKSKSPTKASFESMLISNGALRRAFLSEKKLNELRNDINNKTESI